MTDDKLSNISRAGAMAIIIFICLLVFIAKAFGQDSHDHKGTSFKRFDSIRLNPPAKVTGIIQTEQGERIEWVSYDKHEIRNGSFTLSKDTQKDPKVKEKVWVWIVFCTEDQYVYAVYPLTAIQERAIKP